MFAKLSATVKTLNIVLITLLSLVILSGIAFFVIGYFKPKPAGLVVRTLPESMVYINNEFLGKTPLDTTLKPGETIVKVVPIEADKKLLPYEAKVVLTSGVKTVLRYEFAENDAFSSGEIVSFEKDTKSDAGIVVVSTPDNSQVTVDGVSRGFSPVKVNSIAPGEHQLSVKSIGYVERVLTIKAVSGYKLTIVVKLPKSPEEQKEEVKIETKTYVEILTTPTGFLRVRTEPGSKGSEIDQVKPGNKYLLLKEDEPTGWYQIQLEEPVAGLPNGRTGWISNEYAKVSTESATIESQ